MNNFSFETVKDFDNHIDSSIYGYGVLHSLIINISSFFIKKGTVPVDLGCTTGSLLKRIKDQYGCDVIGYDINDSQFIEGIDLRKQDISDSDFKLPNTNLIYSIFTFKFIDFNKRIDILKKVYNALNKNGCFIFCEKEIFHDGVIQEVFTFSNYQYKQSKFTPAEILMKEYDLRSLMNSINSDENKKLLNKAGFTIIEPFFQSLNFKGYLCRK